MFVRSFTGFKNALKTGNISLVSNSSFFFASSRVVTKQGYFIPQPPKRAPTSLSILQRILKQDKIEHTKQQLEDKTFAPAQRQRAQELYLAEKEAYEKAKKEYLSKYEYPKPKLQPITFYVQKQMKNRGTAKVADWMKKIAIDYKNISEEEKKELKLLSDKDEVRYQKEKEEYIKRNSDLKIPEIQRVQGYNLFIEESAQSKGKEFSLAAAAKEWKTLTKEQQEKYTTKANEIANEREKQLQVFANKLNLNEEDVWILKKGFKENYALREITQEKMERDRKEKKEQNDIEKRKKEVVLEREKRTIQLEKQRERKANLREILAEKRVKNKEKEQLKKLKETQKKLEKKEKVIKKKQLEKVRLLKKKEIEQKREKRQKELIQKKENLKKNNSSQKKVSKDTQKKESIQKQSK